jgi:hypothetical protein
MKVKGYLVVLALGAAGLVALRACDSGHGTEVGATPVLAGEWETSSPGHADRYLEIGDREIVFGQGEEGEARYPVLGIFTEPGTQDGTAFLILYEVEAGEAVEGRLEVIVEDSELRIASQPGVRWTRKS